MALLSRLKVNDFRNLKSVDLGFVPDFNFFVGANGSGKTSLLEAIHVLAVGRSFRTSRLDPLINRDTSQFLIVADQCLGASTHKLGLQRSRTGSPLLRLDGHTQSSWSEVAALLPLQVINSDSFTILEGGGKARRRFLDWALFHVEHSYLSEWRAYRRVVSQRNMLLKAKTRNLNQELDAWDLELAALGESIHKHRLVLLEQFQPVLGTLMSTFLPGMDIQFEYKSGWQEEQTLIQSLQASREKDVRYGVSLSGPHRGDFSLKVSRHSAIDALSRGQTKMLVVALKLAMGCLIKSRSHTHAQSSDRQGGAIYLIDDLAAELDSENCDRVVRYLREAGDQCLFTAITASALPCVDELTDASGKFHVEHGKISVSPATV